MAATTFGLRLRSGARRTEVWKELTERHDLVDKRLHDVDRVFAFLDGMINHSAAMNFSMDKSRKLGWHGFVELGRMLSRHVQRSGEAQDDPNSK